MLCGRDIATTKEQTKSAAAAIKDAEAHLLETQDEQFKTVAALKAIAATTSPKEQTKSCATSPNITGWPGQGDAGKSLNMPLSTMSARRLKGQNLDVMAQDLAAEEKRLAVRSQPRKQNSS